MKQIIKNGGFKINYKGENTPKLQQFSKNIKKKLITNSIKMPSWKAWVWKPSVLTKRERKHKHF